MIKNLAIASFVALLGVPASSQDLLPLEDVAVFEVAYVDPAPLLVEDEARERQGLPSRYAVPHDVDITPAEQGTWEDLDANTVVWRLLVHGFGARSLNLGFGNYFMPAGGELRISSPDGTQVIRPFTEADNEEHGELWTPIIGGEALVIELVMPRTALDDFRLTLTRIGYGYRGFMAGGSGGGIAALSQSCNVDVICPEGDPWRLEIPSVGAISLGGSLFCSGVMLNNMRQDRTPYFLTADHCGVRAGNAASLVVYWNYENTICRPPGSPQSGGPGDGNLTQFNTGSFLRARFVPSDFTLVELDDDPDPAFGVSFAGWNNSGDDAMNGTGIHHPNVEEKRISFDFDRIRTTSYFGTTSPGDGTHVYVSDWDIGTTEGGSSGSPLFDQDHRVIGQLGGGVGTCSSALIRDWYGSFARSWTGGGSNGNRLSNWLDPDGTGALTLDTLGPCAPSMAATVSHTNGTGINLDTLTATEVVVGTLWNATLAPQATRGAGAWILFLRSASTAGPVLDLGTFLGLAPSGSSELLVGGGHIADFNAPAHAGGGSSATLSARVPLSCGLVGNPWHAQAMVFGDLPSGGGVLDPWFSSAAQGMIGTF